jgi:S-DNA-T family DNA segregation ATPase FtsK/SpoIIIE
MPAAKKAAAKPAAKKPAAKKAPVKKAPAKKVAKKASVFFIGSGILRLRRLSNPQ